jgi:phosphoribosylamine--glycine ligase
MGMKVLVIGGGGREHALAWRLKTSPSVESVVAAPGNPGMENDGIASVAISDHGELAAYAVAEGIDLTVVGPEVPLCDGIVNAFRDKGLAIFGPDREAAQLEGSKVYAKNFMERHNIPTAGAAVFHDAPSALDYLATHGAPVVVKASGLAAGKGVTVAMTADEAEEAIRNCFSGGFGAAGEEVLLEEFMMGEEASIFAFVDNHGIKALATSQDHKRIGEGDTGPNTGGMGAYSPAPVVTDAVWARIEEEVLQPFFEGCQKDGLDYRGVIYVGLMIDEAGTSRVVEFNVRMGDPETQPIMMRLASDLGEGMLAAATNKLADYEFIWHDDPAVCVVLASGGYPGSYEKGKAITGCAAAEDMGAKVFHAGTKMAGDQLVTNGGRVLGVTATAPSIQEAVAKVYRAVDCIRWDGVTVRRDIAHRALARDRDNG